MSTRSERALFAAIALLTFLYVAIRAALVPLTHDEAATFQTYVLTGRYLPYLAHWDAGNHLLITAIGRGCYLLLGPAPLSLRAFNVAGFVLYAWYAWRITRDVRDGLIRSISAAALLLCPFVLDFFSLFRGYGASLAFLLMAVFHASRSMRTGARTDLAWMLLALLLANLASLSLLIIWCMGLVGACYAIATKCRRDPVAWGLWLVLGGVPLTAAARYSMELAERGLLYYGTPDGLLRGTLPSLGAWVLGLSKSWPSGLVLLLPLAVALWAMMSRPRSPIVMMILAAVAGELMGRAVLGAGFKVLYPMDRTALHLVPLLILLAAFALDDLTRNRSNAWRWASVPLLWLPIRSGLDLNIDHAMFWPEQAIPGEVYDMVLTRQAAKERPLLVGGYRQNPRSWAYGSMLLGGELNFLDDAGFPQPTCDLMIMDPSFFEAPMGFHEAYRAPYGRVALLERDSPLRTAIVRDSIVRVEEGAREFAELWAPAPEEIMGREWLIEINAEVSSPTIPLELRVVVEVKATDGETLHYDVVDLEDLGADWTEKPVRILRRLPALSTIPGRVVCYLWNPRLQTCSSRSVRIRIHEVLPD